MPLAAFIYIGEVIPSSYSVNISATEGGES